MNQFSLLFDNDLDQHSVLEIEDLNNANIIKSNTEQTSSSYSVEFPQCDRSADELKLYNKKRYKSNDGGENILYCCEICELSFSDKTDYHKHELVHYVDYPYECKFCKNRFKRFKQLENHKMYYHVEDSSEESDSNGSKICDNEEIDKCGDDTKEKQYREVLTLSNQKIQCDVVKSPSTILNENSKKNYETTRMLGYEIDRKTHSFKTNNKDFFICETCGQKFSTSSIHKCSKLKITPIFNSNPKVVYRSFDFTSKVKTKQIKREVDSENIKEKKVKKLKITLKKNLSSTSSNVTNGKNTKKKVKVKLKLKPNEETIFKCKHCDEEFDTSVKRRKHEQSTHAKRDVKYNCDKCNYSTYTKGCFTTHLKRHIKQYALFCEECNVGFFNNTELTSHDIKFHNSQPFQCAICNDTFTSKGNLYSHIKSHDPNNSFVCEICGRTYKKNNSYKRHIARSHLGLTTKAQCQVCQKVLSSKEHLRRHMLTHTDERNWVCSTCGKCFLSKTYLTEHSRIHLGIRPYKCEICEKSFTQRGSLTIHKRSHTGERPYRCEYCSKGFVMSTLLRYHLKKCAEAKMNAHLINNSASVPRVEFNNVIAYSKLPQQSNAAESTEIDPLNNCAVIHATK